jgi:hypothetical protein
MGRMKDLTIDSSTEDLEFLAEMQAHAVSLPCIRTSHEQTAYLLMQDGKPIRVYTDRALALYECWVCTRGDENAENPSDYYILSSTLDTSPSNNIFGE